MKKNKIVLVLLAVFVAMFVLVACNNEPDVVDEPVEDPVVEDVTEEPADEEPVDEVEDVEQVTIRLGTWESGNGYDMARAIADSFMDQNPHINVVIESHPDGFGERLVTQLAANTAPDLFQIGDGDVAMFQSRGAFADLTPFINGNVPLDVDEFFGPMLDIGRIDGGIYTLPKDFSTLAVYYNRDMFDAAGIDYPTSDWTWEEFREIAIALTDHDNDIWGAHLIGGGRWALPMIYAFGGDVISADGTTVDGYLNSPETIAALEFLNQLINVDEVMPSQVSIEALQGVDLFLSERVAMQIHGVWPANGRVEAEMNFGTVMLPGGPVAQAGTIAYAGYGMWADTEHPEEAWAFLQYLVTEGQHILAAHALSAYLPAVESTGQRERDHLVAFIDSVEIMRMFPERLNPHFGSTAGRQFNAVLEDINLGLAEDIAAMLNEAAAVGQEEMEIEMSFAD